MTRLARHPGQPAREGAGLLLGPEAPEGMRCPRCGSTESWGWGSRRRLLIGPEGRRALRLRRRRCRRCLRVWTLPWPGLVPRRRYLAEVLARVAGLRRQGETWEACAERCVRDGEGPDPRTLRRWAAAGLLASQRASPRRR